jgi:2-polyprenyl-3-methyl-5-hydroxy-6-metoxy-1,4-benzoquinol methylase
VCLSACARNQKGVADNGNATMSEIFDEIDPFVQERIPYTNGFLYRPMQFHLSRYPIPGLRLDSGDGKRLLDLGCNWGRWSIAAARKGYTVSGIDPSPQAILAARRVAEQLALDIDYRSGSGEVIPFAENSFDVVFSYSVLQHLAKERVRKVIAEIDRVLKPGGVALIQMPNWMGIRCLYHQARRGFRAERDFEVRYWGISELRQAFGVLGEVELSVDGFFGLGIQPSDVDLLPRRYRAIVHASEAVRGLARYVPFLLHVADSVYVMVRKAGGSEAPQ